jgi:2',3'-cyclic-nucleotide 2'-phosphodiesterase (5'-nucleotidase family)
MLLQFRKSLRFFSIGFVILFSFSCSKQTGLYKVKETKSFVYEINKELGEDSSMIRLLHPYSDSLNKTMGKVISFSEQRMSKGFPEGLLGNFLTDLIYNYAIKNLNLGVDFCLQNNGGFRADLPAGSVTVKNIYEIMPFDNELVILEIDPKTMDALLKYISTGEAVSVSGIRIIIHKNSKNEAFVNNLPIDTAKTYLMATSDYLANGGSKMYFLKSCKRAYETKLKIRDIEIAALEQIYSVNQHVNSIPDGRIRIVE